MFRSECTVFIEKVYLVLDELRLIAMQVCGNDVAFILILINNNIIHFRLKMRV